MPHIYRLFLQSVPERHGRQNNGAGKVTGELVIARGDPAEILSAELNMRSTMNVAGLSLDLEQS